MDTKELTTCRLEYILARPIWPVASRAAINLATEGCIAKPIMFAKNEQMVSLPSALFRFATDARLRQHFNPGAR